MKLTEFRDQLCDRVSRKLPVGKSVPDSIYDIKEDADDLARSMRVNYGATRMEREDWLREFLKSLVETVKSVRNDYGLDAVSDSDEDADLGPLDGSLHIEEDASRASLMVWTKELPFVCFSLSFSLESCLCFLFLLFVSHSF